MKTVFDSVVPLFFCKDIFKTLNFAVTLYLTDANAYSAVDMLQSHRLNTGAWPAC